MRLWAAGAGAAMAVTAGCAARAADGDLNLRFYSIMDSPAQLTLDGAPLGAVGGNSFRPFTVSPGAHRLSAAIGGVEVAQAEITLVDDQMAVSREHRWWCVALGMKDDAPKLIQLTQEKCRQMADLAPANDLPRSR